jgi:hypothetical protein
MKRLRIARSMSLVRRRTTTVAVIAAGLIALAALSAVPAAGQLIGGSDQLPDAGQHGLIRVSNRLLAVRTGTADDVVAPAGTSVNFRKNALFTCFGANGTGTATANTAQITASLTTITAKLTVQAPAGTMVFGQLTQSGCARLKFFNFTVPPSGTGTITVTDLRISGDAFAWFNDTHGDFQITPEVVF